MSNEVNSVFADESWGEVPNDAWAEDALGCAGIVETFTGEITPKRDVILDHDLG